MATGKAVERRGEVRVDLLGAVGHRVTRVAGSRHRGRLARVSDVADGDIIRTPREPRA